MGVEVSPLAASWDWVFLSSRAHRLGHSRALLFKSPMALAATGNGGDVYGVRYLGLVADAPTTNVSGLYGSLSRCARLVDIHPPFA